MLSLSGYAAITAKSYSMGWYTERVRPGAFKVTLASNPDVCLNLDHGRAGSGLPIARTTGETLRLTEDSVGLRVAADLDLDDPDVFLLAQKRRSGNLDGQMSMAFVKVRDTWSKTYDDRELIELNLHRGDVSVVTHAASPTTFSNVGPSESDEGRAPALTLLTHDFRADRARLEALRHRISRR
jgi:HK97 family phage prohead protease